MKSMAQTQKVPVDDLIDHGTGFDGSLIPRGAVVVPRRAPSIWQRLWAWLKG